MTIVELSPLKTHLKEVKDWTYKGQPALKSLCPYHEDSNPSFAVFGNGGFKCYSCPATGHVNELCDHLQIPRIVTNDESTQRTNRSANQWLEATYTYKNADGSKFGIVEVYRQVNGDKKPLPKVGNNEQYGRTKPFPLYRSEELARNKLDIVWFVEGEKCVEAMRERGLLATTNQGGSKSYSQVDADSLNLLNRRTVIILPDNDDPGEVLAEQVYNDCKRRGCTVSILRLPGLVNEGDDVYDWFKVEGNTAERLRELAEEGVNKSRAEAAFVRQCQAAMQAIERGDDLNEARKSLMNSLSTSVGTRSKFELTAAEAFEEWARRKESGDDEDGWWWGVESVDDMAGKLVRRRLIAIAGDSGSGKSTFALQAADAIANTGSAVRIYSQEMEAVENVQRIAARLYNKRVKDFSPSEIREIARIYSSLPLSIWERRVNLDFLIADIRLWAALQEDPGLVVVDFVQLMERKAREQEHELVHEVAYAMKDLAKELNICIVLLGQLTLNSRRDPDKKLTKADVRGGGSLADASDQFFLLQSEGEPDKQGTRFVNVILDKFRAGAKGERSLVFDGPHYEFRDKYPNKLIDSRDRFCYSVGAAESVESTDVDF